MTTKPILLMQTMQFLHYRSYGAVVTYTVHSPWSLATKYTGTSFCKLMGMLIFGTLRAVVLQMPQQRNVWLCRQLDFHEKKTGEGAVFTYEIWSCGRLSLTSAAKDFSLGICLSILLLGIWTTWSRRLSNSVSRCSSHKEKSCQMKLCTIMLSWWASTRT